MSGRSTTVALACSIAAHAVVLLAVGVVSRPAGAVEPAPAVDRWAGDTFDLEALLPRGDPGPSPQPAETGGGAGSVQEKPEPVARPEPVAPPEPSPKPAEALPTPKPTRTAPPQTRPKPASTLPAETAATHDHGTPERPGHQPASAASRAVPAASAAPEVGAGAGTRTAGSSGAVGVGGVRNLAVAFTRALPMAVSGDPVWSKLALGDAGNMEIRIEVDEAGKIISAGPVESPVAPHLQGLIQRTLPFLRAGRFALLQMQVEAGVQTLEVSVTLSEVAGGVGADDPSAGPYALGFEPPGGGRPGRAYFTLRSGRHVEIVVKVAGAG